MDYQGRSIQTGGADPAILIIQGEIAALQTRVKSLDGAVGNLETEEKNVQTQLAQVQTRLTSLEGVVQTMQTVLGDCESIVLTCPVATDTATLRVPIAFNWDTFYSTGYQPVGTPFDLTPFAANNFQLAPNPIGLYWNRPAEATGDTAAFEIDAEAAFIPSIDMAVRIGIKVMPSLFSPTPMFVIGYGEQRYSPSAFVANWSARMIVSVPLKNATLVASSIIFQVESRTSVLGGAQFVYGIGESFANQHHLIVKRIR